MKLFKKENRTKEIILLTVLVILFNFIVPNYAQADFGGTLFNPLAQLLRGICDSIINLLEDCFVGFNGSNFQLYDNKFLLNGTAIYYSPAIIFSNKVPLFSINFITDEKEQNKEYVAVNDWSIADKKKFWVEEVLDEGFVVKYKMNEKDQYEFVAFDGNYPGSSYNYNGKSLPVTTMQHGEAHIENPNTGWDSMKWYHLAISALSALKTIEEIFTIGDGTLFVNSFTLDNGEEYILVQGVFGLDWTGGWFFADMEDDVDINAENSDGDKGNFRTSIRKIAKGTDLYGASSWKINEAWECCMLSREGQPINSTKVQYSSAHYLQQTIVKWYKTFRRIALVALLSILIYIGIRMLLTTVSQDKAKYKKMMLNWLVAILMLFFMQYLMLFIINITEGLIGLFDTSDFITEGGADVLMSQVRTRIGSSDDFSTKFGYLVEYIVLVILTCTFTIQYIKRTLYIAFFTMISPLVCLTYPLDKIKDGQAQAFGIWLKEFIFNALLPVMHILIYYVFVSSATELMTENVIFALITLGFMTAAEKFFRKMFGFDKATSTGAMAGAAGGAMLMNAVNKMKAPPPKEGKEEDVSKIRTKGGDKAEKGSLLNSPTPRTGTPGGGTSTDDTSTDRTSTDRTSTDRTSTDDTSTDRTSTDRTSTDRTSTDRTSTDRTSTDDTSTDDSKDTKPKRDFWGGIENAARGHWQRKGEQLKGKAHRFFKRAPGAAIGAAALGTIGLAAGIASGDLGKTAGYVAAGAAVGSKAGGNITENMNNNFAEDARDFQKGFMGTDEYKNKLSDKKFYSSQEWRDITNRTEMKDTFENREEMRKAYDVFRQSGITDNDKIAKALGIKNLFSSSDSAEVKAREVVKAINAAKEISRLNTTERDAARNQYQASGSPVAWDDLLKLI